MIENNIAFYNFKYFNTNIKNFEYITHDNSDNEEFQTRIEHMTLKSLINKENNNKENNNKEIIRKRKL